MEQEITVENIRNIKIKSLALNQGKFGELIFERSYEILLKLQSLFVEIDELKYKELLSSEEVAKIDTLKGEFITYLQKIAVFEISQSAPKDIHDQIENEIDSFYNRASFETRSQLVLLRQETSKSSRDIKALRLLEKETLETKSKYEEVSGQLQKV